VSPATEYSERLEARAAQVVEHDRRHVLVGNLRLLIFFAGVAIAWLALARHVMSQAWLAIPVIIFALLAAYHSRILRARILAERASNFYRIGLARIGDDWTGVGEAGDRFADSHHVYASDLDLFGRGGLFQLLSTARTRMGEDTLARWLLSPAPTSEILARQHAVADLRPRLDLRETLAVLGEDAGVGVHPPELLDWAESPNVLPTSYRAIGIILAAGAVATAIIWAMWDRALPFLSVIAVEAILTYRLRHRLDPVLHQTEHTFESLDLLSAILARFECETFTAARMRQIAATLTSHQVPGSRAIARLRKIVDWSMSRENLFLRILDIPLMYSLQVAIAAENWRRAHGKAVRGWLESVGEIEAVLSLAAYSYEHPSDPFPEFDEGPAIFEAKALAHPLLPAITCVSNDVRLNRDTRVLLVSGSNMSGKSTLLRAVGINTVLAMAGAPVRAARLRLTNLQVGASIRVNDSLQEGSSRFYAEIKRLRQIWELATHKPDLIFLLDELLQGTNSKDRQIGAEGLLHALVQRGAIGLVTTHDLALAEIERSFGQQVSNVHFQDELHDGRISFDYRLRPGVVTKSNGLALMRSIGLDV
jgi:MutS domain V